MKNKQKGEEVQPMKVVLAGGAGFVGRNLIRVMINEGFEPEDITVLDKNERNRELLEKYRVKKIVADLAENGEWMIMFKGADYTSHRHRLSFFKLLKP